MARGSKINAELALDSKGAEKNLDRFGGKLDGLSKIKGPLMAAGAIAAVGVAAAVAGVKVFQATAQLELGANKIATVFGDNLPEISKWADSVRLSMGSTRQETLMLAAGFQDLLVPMGFSRKEAAALTTETVGLSAALSEWSGGTKSAAEIAGIFSKAMLGEREQLKTLGISITELDVKTKLLASGQEKLTGNALAQAKALATQQLIFEKSTDAQEAFRKGGDSLGRTQQALMASLKQMKEDVMISLIPAMKEIGTVLKDEVIPQLTIMGEWLGETMPSKIEATVDALKGLKRSWDVYGKAKEIAEERAGRSGFLGMLQVAAEDSLFDFQRGSAAIASGGQAQDEDLPWKSSRQLAKEYFEMIDKLTADATSSMGILSDSVNAVSAGVDRVVPSVSTFTLELLNASAKWTSGSAEVAKQLTDRLAHMGQLYAENLAIEEQKAQEAADATKAAQDALKQYLLDGEQNYRDRVMSAMVSNDAKRLAFLKKNNKKIEDNVVEMMDSMRAAGFTNEDIARVDIYGQVIDRMWKTHQDGIDAAKKAEDELAAKRQAEIGQMGRNNAALVTAMHASWVAGGMQGLFDPTQQFNIKGHLEDIPKAHNGGRIGGPVGRETPIMALGGETVLPIGANQGVTINFNGLVAGDPVAIGREIANIVNKSSRANGAIINSSAVTS